MVMKEPRCFLMLRHMQKRKRVQDEERSDGGPRESILDFLRDRLQLGLTSCLNWPAKQVLVGPFRWPLTALRGLTGPLTSWVGDPVGTAPPLSLRLQLPGSPAAAPISRGSSAQGCWVTLCVHVLPWTSAGQRRLSSLWTHSLAAVTL